MTTDPRNGPGDAATWSQQLRECIDMLNVAFLLTAFLFAVLSLIWAVDDRSVAELICAFGLFLCGGGLLAGFMKPPDGGAD